MSTFILFLMQFSTLACALVAGVFLAFSDFIMRSLALTSGDGGVQAMQVINREVFRWVFMALFLGMAPISLVIGGYAWINVTGASGLLILSAAIIYLVGCFGVTIVFNVPKNEALAGMALSDASTRDYCDLPPGIRAIANWNFPPLNGRRRKTHEAEAFHRRTDYRCAEGERGGFTNEVQIL